IDLQSTRLSGLSSTASLWVRASRSLGRRLVPRAASLRSSAFRSVRWWVERQGMQIAVQKDLIEPVGKVVVKLRGERLQEQIKQDHEKRDSGQEHEHVLQRRLAILSDGALAHLFRPPGSFASARR